MKTLSRVLVGSWVQKRRPDTHKGDYGHVLVVAGSCGMSGAGVLAALGAIRGGAGLVTLAMPRSVEPIAAKKTRPEIMTLPLPETPAGTISPSAAPVLMDFIRRRRISAVLVGPGLSSARATETFLKKFLLKIDASISGIVIDADGFTSLKKAPEVLSKIVCPVIVTPHPGEMAKFLGVPTARVQNGRIQTALKFARLNKVIAVLKGHHTLATNGKEIFLNPTGNPGMATAGSGDVLSGLIAALLGQTRDPLKAAGAGVFIHGLAGDIAAKEKTEVSLIAGDIAENIPKAFRKVLA